LKSNAFDEDDEDDACVEDDNNCTEADNKVPGATGEEMAAAAASVWTTLTMATLPDDIDVCAVADDTGGIATAATEDTDPGLASATGSKGSTSLALASAATQVDEPGSALAAALAIIFSKIPFNFCWNKEKECALATGMKSGRAQTKQQFPNKAHL
jgi:hypothetical protein